MPCGSGTRFVARWRSTLRLTTIVRPRPSISIRASLTLALLRALLILLLTLRPILLSRGLTLRCLTILELSIRSARAAAATTATPPPTTLAATAFRSAILCAIGWRQSVVLGRAGIVRAVGVNFRGACIRSHGRDHFRSPPRRRWTRCERRNR